MKGGCSSNVADRYVNWSISSSRKMPNLVSNFRTNTFGEQSPVPFLENPQYFGHVHKLPSNLLNDKQPIYATGRLKYSFPLCAQPENFNHLNVTLFLYKDAFINGRTADSITAQELVQYMQTDPRCIIENYSVDLSCASATHIIMPFDRLEVGSHDGLIALFNWFWSGQPPANSILTNAFEWVGSTTFSLSNHYSLLADIQLY